MTGAAGVAQCRWSAPGGASAAQAICEFLARVGIAVRTAQIEGEMFLPAMQIRDGAILVDPAQEAHPGDLLHEAGHIAVVEAPRRETLSDVGSDPAEEMAAIAWSVAAAKACGVPLDVLFHPHGYKGGSQSLIDAFALDCPPGMPLLSAWGMSADPRFAAEWGREPYPAMTRWLR